MKEIKKVLLLTNSTTDAEIGEIKESIIQAEKPNLKIALSIVHVIPTLPTCYFNIPSMVLLAERYYEEAKQTLSYIGHFLQIHERDQWLLSGKIRGEVLRLAHKLNSHFILASSTNIQELHKTFLFNRKAGNTPIRTINHIGSL